MSSLWTYAAAPHVRASAGRSSWVYVDSRITGGVVGVAEDRRLASMPLIPGRLMSIRTSPGWCSAARSTASSPDSASATTEKPGRQADDRAGDGAERRLIVDDQDRHLTVGEWGRPRSSCLHGRTRGRALPGCQQADRRWC